MLQQSICCEWHVRPPQPLLISPQPRLQADPPPINDAAAFILLTTHCCLLASVLSSAHKRLCVHPCLFTCVRWWHTCVFQKRRQCDSHLWRHILKIAVPQDDGGGRVWRGSVSLGVCVYKERVRTSSPAPCAQWLQWRSGLWLRSDPQQGVMLTSGSRRREGGRERKELRGFSVHSAAVTPAHVGFQSNSWCGLLHGWCSGFPSGNW